VTWAYVAGSAKTSPPYAREPERTLETYPHATMLNLCRSPCKCRYGSLFFFFGGVNARNLPLRMRACLSPRNAYPHECYRAEFGHWSSGRSTAGKICLLHPTFHGHSVTGTNMDQLATYDFLFVIHNNHWPLAYLVLLQFFQPACILNLTERVPMEFCNGAGG